MAVLVLIHLLTMLIGAGLDRAATNALHPMRLVLPVVMILVGNFLPRVRPNYFAGLRTPWTLASETVWRRSNRLAGKTLFAGGIAAFALLFVPGTAATYAIYGILVAAIMIADDRLPTSSGARSGGNSVKQRHNCRQQILAGAGQRMLR